MWDQWSAQSEAELCVGGGIPGGEQAAPGVGCEEQVGNVSRLVRCTAENAALRMMMMMMMLIAGEQENWANGDCAGWPALQEKGKSNAKGEEEEEEEGR